jgi:hypothetical protein
LNQTSVLSTFARPPCGIHKHFGREQARAAKAAVAGAVAAVDRAIAAAERCRQAEAQQEGADSTRSSPDRANAPTHQPKRTRK